MTIPTGNGTVKSPEGRVRNIESACNSAKVRSQRIVTVAQAGNLTFEDVTRYFSELGNSWQTIEAETSAISAADLNTEAQDYYKKPTLDYAAEAAAAQSEIDTVLTWIFNNIDKTSPLTFNQTDRNVDWTTYTAGQTSQFRSVVNDLVAVLD